jgi:type VI secretion system protein ImpM
VAFGAFGKIPTEGEFVRVNASSLAAHEFDDWLQEGIAVLVQEGSQFPRQPFLFLFRGETSAEVLVGVIAPSGDSRGRVFPLAIFATLKATDAAQCFPEVPFAWSRALEDAWRVVMVAGRLTPAQLAEQVRALTPASAAEVDAGRTACRQWLAGLTVGLMTERVLGDLASGRPHYAWGTFLRACGLQQGKEPTRSSIVLDCPIAADVPPLAWLETARRLLQWPKAPPSFLWTYDPVPRLLLSLGPCSPASLPHLVGADLLNPKLWPLTTDVASALAQAKSTLAPAVRRAVESPDLPLEAFLGTLAG